jgi:hypothetical protein
MNPNRRRGRRRRGVIVADADANPSRHLRQHSFQQGRSMLVQIHKTSFPDCPVTKAA